MMTNYNIDILEVDREKLAILLRLLMDPFHLSCEQIKELL